MKQTNSSQLVPLSAAAAELGIQTKELRLEIEQGGLPHARVGARAILVDVALIRDVLSRRAAASLEEVRRDS